MMNIWVCPSALVRNSWFATVETSFFLEALQGTSSWTLPVALNEQQEGTLVESGGRKNDQVWPVFITNSPGGGTVVGLVPEPPGSARCSEQWCGASGLGKLLEDTGAVACGEGTPGATSRIKTRWWSFKVYGVHLSWSAYLRHS